MRHQLYRLKYFSRLYSRLLLSIAMSCLLLAGCNSLSQAQKSSPNALTHLSTAVRSDGKGQVVRFHLRQKADSFRVYQPQKHLVQVALLGKQITTDDIAVPSHSPAFNKVDFHKITNGIGINIHLKNKGSFTSDIYRDAQSNDILLALTKTEPKKLRNLTSGKAPISWQQSAMPPPSSATVQTGGGNRAQESAYSKVKNKMKFDTVVLDPGHGGHDTGAPGYGGIHEKDIALKIAKKVGGYINENIPNVKVIYTRDDDRFIELEERGSIANREEGDLFVSIHCNSARSRQAHGSEVYFLGLERTQTALEVMKRENKVVRANRDDEQKELSQEELLIYELANSGYISSSERIAGMIEHQFDERAQRKSRGVKQARFVVLYHASMPAVLVETGFISNPNEAKYLSSEYGQNIIASAIFRAIRNYKNEYEKSQHLKTK